MTTIAQLDTPELLLDIDRLKDNIARAQNRAAALGVKWRPHVKTHKCIEVGRLQQPEPGPITVSTLKEAEYFAQAGWRDMIYAVGLAPHRLQRVARLIAAGVEIKVIVDNVTTAQAISAFCAQQKVRIGVLIEIDCDGHRSGVPVGNALVVDIARALTGGAHLMGVLTHAGESYNAKGEAALLESARGEVASIIAARDMLLAAGFACPIVSVGSTPTLTCAQSAVGVTEYRSGVGTFWDLVMHNIGVCAIDEIAVSVLVTVIGHQSAKGWVITDGGFMAMSRDRGTANQANDCGYGLVCDAAGHLIEDLFVRACNQEHGIVCRRSGEPLTEADYPIGTRLRVLPNHACATAAAFGAYRVVRGEQVLATWPRCNHW